MTENDMVSEDSKEGAGGRMPKNLANLRFNDLRNTIKSLAKVTKAFFRNEISAGNLNAGTYACNALVNAHRVEKELEMEDKIDELQTMLEDITARVKR